MANATEMPRRAYVELSNLTIDYADGDVAIYDKVTDLTDLYPLRPTTNVIALCTAGSVVVTIGGRAVHVGDGEILFCPPNVKVESCSSEPGFECKIVSLSDHVVKSLLRDKIETWNRAVYINQTNVIRMSRTCREEMGFYYALIRSKIDHSDRGSSREIVHTLIRALLIELCDVIEASEGGAAEAHVLQSKQLFNRFLNMLSGSEVKRRPVAYYASQLAISPKYLTMLCQQYSGRSASDWIIQYMLDDIRYYLADRDCSIKEISVKLGFSNMSHFGAYVRKHLGVSPSEYRDGITRQAKH